MTSYPGGELMGLDPAEIHFDEAGSTPLYIDLACENLRQLQEEVNDIKYVQESAEDLPPSVRGLINSMLERLEKAHGRTIVSEICSLLHSSKFGLAQDEQLKLRQQRGSRPSRRPRCRTRGTPSGSPCGRRSTCRGPPRTTPCGSTSRRSRT